MLIGIEAEVMAGIIAKKIINAYNSKLETEVRLALDSIKCLITETESETEGVIPLYKFLYNYIL